MEAVIAIVNANVALAKNIVRAAIPKVVAFEGPAPHANALAGAIMSSPSVHPPHRVAALAPIVGKYLG